MEDVLHSTDDIRPVSLMWDSLDAGQVVLDDEIDR